MLEMSTGKTPGHVSPTVETDGGKISVMSSSYQPSAISDDLELIE